MANVPLDMIVAVVNEDVIMESELINKVESARNQIQQRGGQIPPGNVLERQVLDGLIQSRIQLQLADRAGIRVNDESLNSAINNIAANNNVSLSQFRRFSKKMAIAMKNFVKN